MATPRAYHAAVRLQSGKVLVVGGQNSTGRIGSAEVYDPATNSWTSAGSLATPRATFGGAVLLPSGKVIVSGGITNGNVLLSSTEIYDPVSNSWSAGPSLANGVRADHFTAL